MYKELDTHIKIIYLRESTNSSPLVYELYKRNKDIPKYVLYNSNQLALSFVDWNEENE